MTSTSTTSASISTTSVSTATTSIVKKHGFLKVVGNKVTSESGEPVRLRGMSLFWSQWKPQFWTKGTTEWLQKDWGVSLIRAAMAVESDGYLTNKRAEIKKVKTVVDAAIDVGIYVTRHRTWAVLSFHIFPRVWYVWCSNFWKYRWTW